MLIKINIESIYFKRFNFSWKKKRWDSERFLLNCTTKQLIYICMILNDSTYLCSANAITQWTFAYIWPDFFYFSLKRGIELNLFVQIKIRFWILFFSSLLELRVLFTFPFICSSSERKKSAQCGFLNIVFMRILFLRFAHFSFGYLNMVFYVVMPFVSS